MAEEGFDAAYAGHFRRLTAQLYAYLGDMAEAQDVVQEAFTRAWVRWDVISRYDDPVAWVRRAAWNLATSRWRRLLVAASFMARQRLEVEPGISADGVDIQRALAMLSPNHRRAIVLHYLSDMSVSDIARETGVSENTVKSWLLRGRAALAELLAVPKEVPGERG